MISLYLIAPKPEIYTPVQNERTRIVHKFVNDDYRIDRATEDYCKFPETWKECGIVDNGHVVCFESAKGVYQSVIYQEGKVVFCENKQMNENYILEEIRLCEPVGSGTVFYKKY